MKQIRFIAVIAAAALAMAGCAKVGELESPEGQEITITASFADEQTKTTLQDGGTQVLWEASDEVKLFFDGNSSRLTSKNTEPIGVASFSGTFNGTINFMEGFSDSTPLWGLYPYRSDATADNESVTTTLPTEQSGKAGSFAKGMNISLAKSKSLSMGFYNVCGGIRFSVTRDDVQNVVFKSLDGTSLAGKVKLAFEGGVPAVQEVIEGQDSIILTAPTEGSFEKGKWYYIVALPCTLVKGFSMTFNTEKQSAVLESSTSVIIKRGIFGSIADADTGLEYKDRPAPASNIIFRDPIAKYACVEKFDTDGDEEISYAEAAAVTSIKGLFTTNYNSVKHFDEFRYFTNVTSLESAFTALAQLESVTIPAGVTTIEHHAFQNCSSLDSVTFVGGDLKTIGSYIFQNCTSLCKLILPQSVENIGEYAFNNCSSLASIEIPSGVAVLNNDCFSDCSSLKRAILPASLTSIGSCAFSGCKKLESVDFPTGLQSVGSYAFRNCSSLESVSLPSAITTLPKGIFCGCTSLCHVTFSEAITAIDDYAFQYCTFYDKETGISKIELPSSLKTIGSLAFSAARNVLVTAAKSFVEAQSNSFSVNGKIYVPDAKVEVYKVRTGWSAYADKIFPLSSYSDEPAVFEAVDLGLSVKWANCNIGAHYPEEYGTYFAWGDVNGQTWNGSYWSGGGFSTYPTYELDENNNLKPEYDAAHVNLGGSWRMPTKAEQQELINNCTSTWTSDYNGTGVAGRIFTSNKEGYTDKSIFLPAAGFGSYGSLYDAGSLGSYWSSTFYYDDYAWYLYFHSGLVYTSGSYRRNYGQSVRPVYDESIHVTGVNLNQSSISIDKGSTCNLTATITPANATNKNVTWSSSDESVASVSSEGVVTANATGSTTITVTTIDGGKTASCAVTVNEVVDLGLSVKWRSWNIGATKPEEYGTYFAWGDVTGQTWNGSSWSGGGFSTYPTYEVDENNNLKPAYDAAHVNLGGIWRMPTKAERDELINNCTSTWTSDYNGTGVAGRIFTSNKEGYTDTSIFLPAAGYGDYSYPYYAGFYGRYWSSTFSNDDYAWSLGFSSGDVSTGSGDRILGRSVRPVTE